LGVYRACSIFREPGAARIAKAASPARSGVEVGVNVSSMKSFSPGFQLELDIFINDQSGFEALLSLSERVREKVHISPSN
jgi:hypothetical protein